jgi:hypothetical protein
MRRARSELEEHLLVFVGYRRCIQMIRLMIQRVAPAHFLRCPFRSPLVPHLTQWGLHRIKGGVRKKSMIGLVFSEAVQRT